MPDNTQKSNPQNKSIDQVATDVNTANNRTKFRKNDLEEILKKAEQQKKATEPSTKYKRPPISKDQEELNKTFNQIRKNNPKHFEEKINKIKGSLNKDQLTQQTSNAGKRNIGSLRANEQKSDEPPTAARNIGERSNAQQSNSNHSNRSNGNANKIHTGKGYVKEMRTKLDAFFQGNQQTINDRDIGSRSSAQNNQKSPAKPSISIKSASTPLNLANDQVENISSTVQINDNMEKTKEKINADSIKSENRSSTNHENPVPAPKTANATFKSEMIRLNNINLVNDNEKQTQQINEPTEAKSLKRRSSEHYSDSTNRKNPRLSNDTEPQSLKQSRSKSKLDNRGYEGFNSELDSTSGFDFRHAKDNPSFLYGSQPVSPTSTNNEKAPTFSENQSALFNSNSGDKFTTLKDIEESLDALSDKEIDQNMENLKTLIQKTRNLVTNFIQSKNIKLGEKGSKMSQEVSRFGSFLHDMQQKLENKEDPENVRKVFIEYVKNLATFRNDRIDKVGKQSRTVANMLNSIVTLEKDLDKSDLERIGVGPLKSKLKEWTNRIMIKVNKIRNPEKSEKNNTNKLK